MCVVDRLILVYPPEIRKPKDKIIPCRYSVDGEACSRAYIRHLGEHYVLSRSRSEGGYARPFTYQIIEPSKYAKPTKEVKAAEPRPQPKRRTINLDLWGIRIPWGKRSVKKEPERRERDITRGRGTANRESTPFIVDPPERPSYRPRPRSRPRSRPPIQEIRPRSPKFRTRPSASPPRQPDPPEPPPSTPSPQKRPRLPRERTPVSDRVPLRPQAPSPPKRPVIVHNPRGDESPPLTPTREHRRQRGLGTSPQTDPIRHVNRSKDLRRDAEKDARRPPEREIKYVTRPRLGEDARRAAWAERDRRYARQYQDERPLRSFADRQYDQLRQRGRDHYGPPVIIQGRGGGRRIRESERIYESEVRNSNRNRYGFPSSVFDRFRPQQEYRDYGPGRFLPRRSSMPYGQKIILDDDTQRSGWRWR